MTADKASILLIEDDEHLRTITARLLRKAGYEVREAEGVETGYVGWLEGKPDLVLLDVHLPDGDGKDLCRRIKTNADVDGSMVVLLSGMAKEAGDIVSGLESGADGYIRRPIDNQELLSRVGVFLRMQRAEATLRKINRDLEDRIAQRTAELVESNARLRAEIAEREQMAHKLTAALDEVGKLRDQLQTENLCLREEAKIWRGHDKIVGSSQAIRTVLNHARQVAPTESTVLIAGETGTGKELLAMAIHDLSPRSRRTLVTINCAAIPSTLIESELFGRERGAYTGALTRQMGRFEMADGSTLFLDEIGELPLETQVKLLRALQEGTFERLGSTKTIKVDVRVIAASNRNLARAVREGKFRDDLYYRLNVFPIEIPPLRDRPEDIPILVWTFVKELSKRMGKKIQSIPRKDMTGLVSYPWPGNVRELRNAVERAMILTNTPTLHFEAPHSQGVEAEAPATLENMERNHILEVLKSTGWRVRGRGGAAEILGLKPTTLESKMKKLGIVREKSFPR